MIQLCLTFTLFVLLNSVSSAPTQTTPIPQEDTEMQATPTPTSHKGQVTTTMVSWMENVVHNQLRTSLEQLQACLMSPVTAHHEQVTESQCYSVLPERIVFYCG